MPTALLLMAHGSRRPEANADLYYVAEQLAASSGYDIVEVSFLELTTPTIPHGGAACAAKGATRVTMLPYFLSPGVHVRDDMEKIRSELQTEFPNVEFRLAQPLGRHPLLLNVLLERAQEAES